MNNRLKENEGKHGLALHTLLECMVDNAESVKFYRSDIFIDIEYIVGDNLKSYGSTTYYWLVRECGTWLINSSSSNAWERLRAIASNYNNYELYIIEYDTDTFWSINRYNNNYFEQ